MDQAKKRKRKPVKPSTLHNWRCILDNHVLPVLGGMPLSDVRNQAMKRLVAGVSDNGLSPSTIRNVTNVVKLVVASATDNDGNQLCPMRWNHEFIDMPIACKDQQKRPCFTVEQVMNIVNISNGRMQMAAILLAASGMRIGELLGLEVRHFDGSSFRIEQEVWGGDGKVYPPKTSNARRVIDLHSGVANLVRTYIDDRTRGFIFQTTSGKPVTQTNLLRRELHPLLKKLGIARCGFHAFRRFRNTFLRQSQCPPGVLTFWLGHAEANMSEHYDRSREDSVYRKDVAERMGVGFELPKTLCPKPGRKGLGVIGLQRELVPVLNR